METIIRPNDEFRLPRQSVKDEKTSPSTTTLEAIKTKDKQETNKAPFAERKRKRLAGIVDWTREIIT